MPKSRMSIEGFTWEVDNDILDTTLFTAISGSHSFGWSTKDSDLDIRETWFPIQDEIMSPFWRPRTLQWKEKCKVGIIDFVSYPLDNYLRLLNKGNGNLLENLFQPKMYAKTNLVKELQNIVIKNIHKGFLKHYLGYSTNLKKDFTNYTRLSKIGIVKLILMRYRVLRAGLTLGVFSKVEPNIIKQEQYFKSKYCMKLLQMYLREETIPGMFISSCKIETDNLHSLLDIAIKKANTIRSEIEPLTMLLEEWFLKCYVD